MAKQKEEPSGNSGGIFNVLAAGTVVTGSILTESDFRLDGRIDGDIHCKGKIVVGPRGSIVGNIFSDNAEILGHVDGVVRIKEKLTLKATASLKGDIYVQKLEIEPDASFNGTCSMGSAQETLKDKS